MEKQALLGKCILTDGPASKKKKHLSLIIRSLIAVLALVWVFRGQNIGELAKAFEELNLSFFLLSLAIYIAAQFLVGFRWWVLLKSQSIYIKIPLAIKLHFIGLFYNNLMPSSIGGDLLRAWYVTRHTDKKLEAALSVFVDRIIGVSGMIFIAIVCVLLFMRQDIGQILESSPQESSDSISQYKWVIIGIILTILILPVLMLLHSKSRKLLLGLLVKIKDSAGHVLSRVKQAIVIYITRPGSVLTAFGITVVLQLLVITAFYVLGLDLEIKISAKYYYVFFPITWIISAIPISIAGAGILEGGIRELFTRFAGVALEKTLALALCQRFIWVLTSLPGAFLHLFGAHLPKDFFIDYQEHKN